MFSMKGKYVKGEDLSNLMKDILDMRIETEVELSEKRGKLIALIELNLISEEEKTYALYALDHLGSAIC